MNKVNKKKYAKYPNGSNVVLQKNYNPFKEGAVLTVIDNEKKTSEYAIQVSDGVYTHYVPTKYLDD